MAETYLFPSHLRFEERFVGPFSQRQFIALVAGCLFGALVWYGTKMPTIPRATVSLVLPLLIVIFSCVRIRGHSLIKWSRLAIAHTTRIRRFSWAPTTSAPLPQNGRGPLPSALGHLEGEAESSSPVESQWAQRLPRTQDLSLIPVSISDGMVKMPDGSYSALLECSGRNLTMLSESDHALFNSEYHRFLCSLTHPVTFLKRIRPAQIRDYLDNRLSDARRLDNPTLAQLELYDIAFMEAMSGIQEGPSATCVQVYIVVPAPGELSGVSSILSTRRDVRAQTAHATSASIARTLNERSESLIRELARIGIHARRLSTSELFRVWHASLCVRTAGLCAPTNDRLVRALIPIGCTTLTAQQPPRFIT